MTSDRQVIWQERCRTFGHRAQPYLQFLARQGGMLTTDQWQPLADLLDLDHKELMVRLLPLAQVYSRAPVSNFEVGAVVLAQLPLLKKSPALFLGANLEFAGLPLAFTLHAEQMALMHAWHYNAVNPQILAVNEYPCGFCRQFMTELNKAEQLTLLVTGKGDRSYTAFQMDDLLPHAIGPRSLGLYPGWMMQDVRPANLQLTKPVAVGDNLIQKALDAAGRSYAPYSGNLAGCALQTDQGRIFTGRAMETMAFNPSCTALQAALAEMVRHGLRPNNPLTRAVLVEKSTTVTQYAASSMLLSSLNPGTVLELSTAS